MSPDDPNNLQFDKAEAVAGPAKGLTCAKCQAPIVTSYYEAGGNTFCETCAKELKEQLEAGKESASFPRALVFGLAGALAGAAVYFAVVAITGYEIGLISILVGFMVGWAVRQGTRGFGSRRYQVLAFALTYLAIASTYTGLATREMAQRGSLVFSRSELATPDTAVISVTGAVERGGGRLLVSLALITLVMPIFAIFGGLPSSLITGLIIGFGLRQAWIMNGPVGITFSGPFRVGTGPAANPPPATA
jgi:hypothetical protein